jgi:hypothetical protein
MADVGDSWQRVFFQSRALRQGNILHDFMWKINAIVDLSSLNLEGYPFRCPIVSLAPRKSNSSVTPVWEVEKASAD